MTATDCLTVALALALNATRISIHGRPIVEVPAAVTVPAAGATCHPIKPGGEPIVEIVVNPVGKVETVPKHWGIAHNTKSFAAVVVMLAEYGPDPEPGKLPVVTLTPSNAMFPAELVGPANTVFGSSLVNATAKVPALVTGLPATAKIPGIVRPTLTGGIAAIACCTIEFATLCAAAFTPGLAFGCNGITRIFGIASVYCCFTRSG
jgi:hypothetical protein